jgi:hypothetical protein
MVDINDLQFAIMVFVKSWANIKKTPIPQKDIIKNFQSFGVKSFTALKAINALIEKGYIRKAYYNGEQLNRTYYVQIRNITVESNYCFKWKPKKQIT